MSFRPGGDDDSDRPARPRPWLSSLAGAVERAAVRRHAGPMPLASALAVLVAANLLTNRLAPGYYLLTCLAAAALLLLISRGAGLGWAELGLGSATVRSGLRWALVTAAVVVAAYLVCLAVPATREVLSDDRAAGLSVGALLWRALVRVPFGTVLLEEVGFRGVLWALLAHRLGHAWATGISSALFGLWHVLPSLRITRANAAAAGVFGPTAAGQVAAVLAAVVGTAAAGVLLCELRRRSGSLLAPAGLHWAANSVGYVLAWTASR